MAKVIQIAVEFGFDPRLFNSRTYALTYYVTLPVLLSVKLCCSDQPPQISLSSNNKGLSSLMLHVGCVLAVVLHMPRSGTQAEGETPILAFPQRKEQF